MLSGSTSYPKLHKSSLVSNTLKSFKLGNIYFRQISMKLLQTYHVLSGERMQKFTDFVGRSGRRIHDMSVKGQEKC